jgi:hypothetical protein
MRKQERIYAILSRKDLPPNKSDLVEYTAITNAIINDAVGKKSSYLYYHLTS